ncbi:MAG: DUF1646 domain-containing protein [Elusimicrobia bacterium]|nr:DUF1646 domain-containing protein [Candidatus Liberimonas magnetica]
MLEISLFSVLLLVLIIPLTLKKVEENLEIFLFIMGILAVTCAHIWGGKQVWSKELIQESLIEPIMITIAVIAAGIIIELFRDDITDSIVRFERRIGSKLFCFVLVTALGLMSSIITAIMASIILVEVVNCLRLNKDYETKLVVLGCFSIGLGAALTPIGEPLSTICIGKLKGEPYNAGFFFLLEILSVYILPGILALGILGAIIEPSVKGIARDTLSEDKKSSFKDVFVYAGKVYIFIMGLVYLGRGFKPIIDTYIIKLPSAALYWINSISAILDNATLTAAEISPLMSLAQIKYLLMGLLIAGGMLIPGNVPNIICAGRLKVSSKQWAKIGVPVGLVLMIIYFIIFSLIEHIFIT